MHLLLVSGVAHAQTEVTTPDQNDSKELEKIEVVGRAFSLYRPTESSFATRTNTPLEKNSSVNSNFAAGAD